MGDGEYSTAYYMKQRFQQFGVQVYTSTKVLEIGSHTVVAGAGKARPSPWRTWTLW